MTQTNTGASGDRTSERFEPLVCWLALAATWAVILGPLWSQHKMGFLALLPAGLLMLLRTPDMPEVAEYVFILGFWLAVVTCHVLFLWKRRWLLFWVPFVMMALAFSGCLFGDWNAFSLTSHRGDW